MNLRGFIRGVAVFNRQFYFAYNFTALSKYMLLLKFLFSHQITN